MANFRQKNNFKNGEDTLKVSSPQYYFYSSYGSPYVSFKPPSSFVKMYSTTYTSTLLQNGFFYILILIYEEFLNRKIVCSSI